MEGLDGLSIARLAEHIGMSKSGLYAHFGSKQALQLATVDVAYEIFLREVVRPAMRQPAGRQRVVALCDAFLSHLDRRVFPGGCFIAAVAAEFDTRDGPVKDRIRSIVEEWRESIADMVRAPEDRREIDAGVDAEQLAFEINALLLGANAAFVLFGDDTALDRARTGIRQRLGVARAG